MPKPYPQPEYSSEVCSVNDTAEECEALKKQFILDNVEVSKRRDNVVLVNISDKLGPQVDKNGSVIPGGMVYVFDKGHRDINERQSGPIENGGMVYAGNNYGLITISFGGVEVVVYDDGSFIIEPIDQKKIMVANLEEEMRFVEEETCVNVPEMNQETFKRLFKEYKDKLKGRTDKYIFSKNGYQYEMSDSFSGKNIIIKNSEGFVIRETNYYLNMYTDKIFKETSLVSMTGVEPNYSTNTFFKYNSLGQLALVKVLDSFLNNKYKMDPYLVIYDYKDNKSQDTTKNKIDIPEKIRYQNIEYTLNINPKVPKNRIAETILESGKILKIPISIGEQINVGDPESSPNTDEAKNLVSSLISAIRFLNEINIPSNIQPNPKEVDKCSGETLLDASNEMTGSFTEK